MSRTSGMSEGIRTNVLYLGAILNDIRNFNLGSFDGQLLLQKTVYLLQVFGVNLDYKFEWYRGTYCQQLTKDGFELETKIGKIPRLPLNFMDEETQLGYNNFLKFIEPHKTSVKMLEIASSICYLHRKDIPKEQVLMLVENMNEEFTKEECQRVWSELERSGVVK